MKKEAWLWHLMHFKNKSMILVADSGSSKTDWAIISKGTNPQFFTSEGYNPYYVTSSFIENSLKLSIPKNLNKIAIESIHFYGAGCFPDKTLSIFNGLQGHFPKAKISVELDILGAAKSLLGDNPGFVTILGTGMNTCIYDGENITQNIDSLGFILGDEGSGAYLGKTLLTDFIRGNLPTEVHNLFQEIYQVDKESIFDHIYNQPLANKYCAGFAPFLLNEIIKSHPYCINLVKSSFHALFKNVITHYPDYQQNSFNCVGSIGYYFKSILLEISSFYDMKPGIIIEKPIDGLVQYFERKLYIN